MSEPPVAEPEPEPSLAEQLLRRGRLIAFAAAFAIELAIFFGAMVYPLDPVQQKALLDQANALTNSATGQGPAGMFSAIFDNNLRVALLEMVPAAGALFFAVSIFTTGQVIQALAISSNLPGPLFGVALFFFPFAIVELSSYAVAVASGTLVLVAWRRKTLASELRVYLLEGIVVVVAVLIAAAMETVGIVNPFVSFALWLPTALSIAMFVVYIRGRRG